MSDQNGGQSKEHETGAKPVAETDALSGRTRVAPVIEGEAVELAPERRESESEALAEEPASETSASTAQETEAPTPAEAAESEAPAIVTPRKSGATGAVAALIGVAALGVGGYYGWTEIGSPSPSDIPARITALLTPSAIKPGAEANSEKAAPAEKQGSPAPTAPAVEAPHKAEGKPGIEAAPEKPAPVAAAPVETQAVPPRSAAPSEEKSEKSETTATKEKTAADQENEAPEKNTAAAAKSAVAAPEPAKAATAEPGSDKSLAQMAAQLATTQAALEQMSQRLKAVEAQLAAPKAGTRAELAARDAGPASAGDASAQLVVAQSLLVAVRQGDDYAPMLAALQKFGGDSQNLGRLRAGLGAPSARMLAADFAALAPRLIASAAPPPAQPEAKAPQGFGEAALAFIESRAKKLVRIRPASAPDNDANAAGVDRIEKDLGRDDIAAALAERAKWPAPALALSADWAKAAQARLDAEEAAKAELAQALQNLSKTKS